MGGDIREAAAAYVRIAKRAAMMAGRYAMPNSSTATVDSCAFCAPALAGSFATYKIGGNADLKAVFAWPLSRADQIRSQQQRQRGPITAMNAMHAATCSSSDFTKSTPGSMASTSMKSCSRSKCCSSRS